jgi:glycerophosphoryl diester phosphodiesterase
MKSNPSHPLRIAHCFGNSRRRLARALQGPVDLIETDVWLEGGGIAVRHERKLGCLPLLLDEHPEYRGSRGPGRFGISLGKWYLKLQTTRLSLEEVLTRAKGKRRLLVDVKTRVREREEAYARALVKCVELTEMEEQVIFCGRAWSLLSRLPQLSPRLTTYYTANEPGLLADFEALVKNEPVPGVCLHHSLIDEPLLQRLKAQGIAVFAWTINDLSRAHELLEMGVDGITSDRLEMLGLLGHRPSEG